MTIGILKKVDTLGRVTLPKEYRDFYHLYAGQQVCVVAVENGLLITNPKYEMVKIEEKDEK